MSQGKIVGDRYKLGKKIGEGTSAAVFVGEQCNSEGQLTPGTRKYAIKVLPMKVVEKNMDQTKREISILKGLRHRHVVALREVLQSANNVYIVMELVQGGTLAHLPLPLPEATARGVMRQLLEGLQYVHAQGVAHRDLKPANVMIKRYQTVGPNGEEVQSFAVKLTDFGLANSQKEQNLLTTRCGTPHYVAPEIVDGRKYDGKASDVWSCGVLLFYIMTGRVPFDDAGLALPQPNFDGLWNKIRHAHFHMPDTFSSEVRRFLSLMLTVDPSQRATVEDCLNDPWLATTAAAPSVASQSPAPSTAASPQPTPLKESHLSGGVDNDRRRSEQEEVLGGEAFTLTSVDSRTLFVSSTDSGSPLSPTREEPRTGVDAFTLYQAVRTPCPTTNLRSVNLYFRLKGATAFSQVVQALGARLNAVNIDVRGAATTSGGPTSPMKGASGGIPVGQTTAVFTGMVNPHKGRDMRLTSVVLLAFRITVVDGLPGACLIQISQAAAAANNDFTTVITALAENLK